MKIRGTSESAREFFQGGEKGNRFLSGSKNCKDDGKERTISDFLSSRHIGVLTSNIDARTVCRVCLTRYYCGSCEGTPVNDRGADTSRLRG